MKTVNLDGHTTEWKICGHLLQSSINRAARSSLHLQARNLFVAIFPTLKIFEECPIPVNDKQILYLDFYIPLRNLAIEVHGEQHYKFISFFHNNPSVFALQKKNDKLKQDWCSKNGIDIIILPYNEDINEWRSKLQ